MKESAFVDELAKKCGLTAKATKEIVAAFWETVATTMKKDPEGVAFKHGKFVLKVKPATKARPGVNPFTKEPITIAAKPASSVPQFKPAKAFKDVYAK